MKLNVFKTFVSILILFIILNISPHESLAESTLDQYCKIVDASGSLNISDDEFYQTFVPSQNRLTKIVVDISGDDMTKMSLMVMENSKDADVYGYSTNKLYIPSGRQKYEFNFDNFKLKPGVGYKIVPVIYASSGTGIRWYMKSNCYSKGSVVPEVQSDYSYGNLDFGFETYGYTYKAPSVSPINIPKNIPDTSVTDNLKQPESSYPDPSDYQIPDNTKIYPDDDIKDYKPAENSEENNDSENNDPGSNDDQNNTQTDFPDPIDLAYNDENTNNTGSSENSNENDENQNSYPSLVSEDTESKESSSVKPPFLSFAVKNTDSVKDLKQILKLTDTDILALYGEGEKNSSIHLSIGNNTYLVKTNESEDWFTLLPIKNLEEGVYILKGRTITDNGYKSSSAKLLTIDLKHSNKPAVITDTSNSPQNDQTIINTLTKGSFNKLFFLLLLIPLLDLIAVYVYIRRKKQLNKKTAERTNKNNSDDKSTHNKDNTE